MGGAACGASALCLAPHAFPARPSGRLLRSSLEGDNPIRMKGYHEYLELHGYFARAGEPKLSRVDYDRADAEFGELARRVSSLTGVERARLDELKAILFRDKP